MSENGGELEDIGAGRFPGKYRNIDTGLRFATAPCRFLYYILRKSSIASENPVYIESVHCQYSVKSVGLMLFMLYEEGDVL